MVKGNDAIARFVAAAHARGAERVRAVATSAVREADNGDAFRAQVEAQAGIALEILSAQEEARLIHLGVANGFPISTGWRASSTSAAVRPSSSSPTANGRFCSTA